MDVRLLALMGLVIAVAFFLLGRRTSPTGRVVQRLQTEIDKKEAELLHYKEQMTQFLKEMRGELTRLSSAHHDLEDRLAKGAKSLAVKLPASAPTTALVSAETDWQAPKRQSFKVSKDNEPLVAAACPIPADPYLSGIPKDYAVLDYDDTDSAAA
jgi:uncharacterized membrane-anchored protein YhcB (DUF1043 family)